MKSEYDPNRPPYDPMSDFYQEYLFSPRALKQELTRMGMKVRIYSVGPSRARLKPLSYLWEAASPLTLLAPRPFRVIAVKEAA